MELVQATTNLDVTNQENLTKRIYVETRLVQAAFGFYCFLLNRGLLEKFIDEFLAGRYNWIGKDTKF
jgi:hypothetical protein